MSAPRLVETMRAEAGRVALLDRHLARLGASAEALGYPFVAETARARVEGAAAVGPRALRLTLAADGSLALDVGRLPEAPLRTAWIDPEPLLGAGSWRCVHKTTARAHYDRHAERARTHGADEAILVNARGEVVEGTRTSVWAAIDGRLWTPPLAAGGLPGVFRAHVLATRAEAGERTLTPDDLRAADAVILSNALRGWMPVERLQG